MNYDDWKTTPPDYEEPPEDEPEEQEESEENEDFPDDYEQEPFYDYDGD